MMDHGMALDLLELERKNDALQAQLSDLLAAIHDAAMQSTDYTTVGAALESIERDYNRRQLARAREQAQKPEPQSDKSRAAMMRNRANRIRINRSDFV